MTANNPNPLDELTKENAQVAQVLLEDLQRRVDGSLPPTNLMELIEALCRVPMMKDADLAAWEPEKLDSTQVCSRNGQIISRDADDEQEPRLSEAEREVLREPLALPQNGISNEMIVSTMLANCRREHPELADRLQHFLDCHMD